MRHRFLALAATTMLAGSIAGCTSSPSDGGGGGALAGCSPVEVIVARGTFEPPETSPLGVGGFVTALQLALPGTTRYDVRYRSDLDYLIAPGQGATDLVNRLRTRAAACPNQRYVLSGYSKGAMVVVLSMSRIPAAIEPRVKAAVLYGNPFHDAGSKANAPGAGNNAPLAGGLVPFVNIPQRWRGKTRDYCNTGDPICGNGINILAHLMYPVDDAAAAAWALQQLGH
jgi:cutinase